MSSYSLLKKAISTAVITGLILSASPIGMANAVANITEVTPVPAYTNTRAYTFSSDAIGNIAYGGPCAGSTTLGAVVGNNTITLDGVIISGTTAVGCTITVDDGGGPGNLLNIPTFVFDNQAPTIDFVGDPTYTIPLGANYTDSGASWSDNVDGGGSIAGYSGSVNTSSGGTYILTFSHTDRAGNIGTKIRTINVSTGGTPTITMSGSANVSLSLGDVYVDSGATAYDPDDHDITSNIVTSGAIINTNIAGTYTVTYNVVDSANNPAPQQTRTVIVYPDDNPVVTLNGPNPLYLEIGQAYTEYFATATDRQDGDRTPFITITGSVNRTLSGVYQVYYIVTDTNSNTSTGTRTVYVADRTPPVISLIGPSTISVARNQTYLDSGATWSDAVDGSGILNASGTVNVSILGANYLTYDYTDVGGNAATTVTRTINVTTGALPTITLSGSNPMFIRLGDPYINPGATASDTEDGTLTGITYTGTVLTNTLGTYTGSYTVMDSSNNSVTVNRTIQVVTGNIPVLTLSGSNPVSIMRGTSYVDSGATAFDTEDGTLTGITYNSGNLNINIAGTYTGTYSVTDSNGNTVTLERTMIVTAGALPVITLNGSGSISLPLGSNYTELGATALDGEDGPLIPTLTGMVNTGSVGTYIITYSVTDSNFNTVTLNRIVDIIDNIPPVITLNGSASVSMTAGSSYVDLGATWTDNIDGSGTIIASGTLNTNVAGVYTLFYNKTDAGGNAGTGVTRTVTVIGTVTTGSNSHAGPGGGAGSSYGGSAYGGSYGFNNVNFNSAPDLPSPIDALIPNIVRLMRTASHSSASTVSLDGTEKRSTHEIINPLTDYICPVVQEFVSKDDSGIQNVSEGEFTSSVQSMMMYRSLDSDEANLNASQRYILGKSFAIVKNDEDYDGKRAITRAEFVKMLVRALACHYSVSGNESEYSDITAGAWYTDYINFASENGWIGGYADGTFRPHDPITRGEAAKILSKAIHLETNKNIDVSFFDVPSSNDFAPYIYALKDNNIIGGRSSYEYALSSNISRNEVAKIFTKIFLNIDSQSRVSNSISTSKPDSTSLSNVIPRSTRTISNTNTVNNSTTQSTTSIDSSDSSDDSSFLDDLFK